MESRWHEKDAGEYVSTHADGIGGEASALCAYLGRLIGADARLGSGSVSVKVAVPTLFGETRQVLLVTAAGQSLRTLESGQLLALDLPYLRRFRSLTEVSDADVLQDLRNHQFAHAAGAPALESLCHGFLSATYVAHCHAPAVAVLSSLPDAMVRVRDALGEGALCLQPHGSWLSLAQATSDAVAGDPAARCVIWLRHGILTLGETAREAYEALVEAVARAEKTLARATAKSPVMVSQESRDSRAERCARVSTIIRGALAAPSGDADRPFRRVIVRTSSTPDVLGLAGSRCGREAAGIPAPWLAGDHRDAGRPLPVDVLDCEDIEGARERIRGAVAERLATDGRMPSVLVLPGVGVYAAAEDAAEAGSALDWAVQELRAKAQLVALGGATANENSPPGPMEQSTIAPAPGAEQRWRAQGGEVALVTGAAGAIGWGICSVLLQQGWHVAAADVSQESLDSMVATLGRDDGERLLRVQMDVTDPASVARGFETVVGSWGGVDLVVLNAGIAHISALSELAVDAFQRLERVNIDGTLLVLAEAARHFRLQGTGGDIVLISTKNVFAPGAKFGAYSATKAAAHQLARIASLELAEMDVRVNMVAPDAVFSGGARKSGLWAEVGPDRMKARGLSEDELEEYYRNRNLLKARISAEHVGRAVLYFATRQTPTTGATIPVDGGLPDATPR